jgi:hypothetical protein
MTKTTKLQDTLHDAAVDALRGRSHAQALRVFVTTLVKQRKLLDALALPYLQQVAAELKDKNSNSPGDQTAGDTQLTLKVPVHRFTQRLVAPYYRTER